MHQHVLGLLLALGVADATMVQPARGQRPAFAAMEDTIVRPSQQFDATRFDSTTAVTLRVILDSASIRGLPVGPLINLALQGAAKRAPNAKILNTVRAHANAMADAKAILGKASVTEIDAAATAMRAGVDGGTLAQLREARPGLAILQPLVVLTDIVQRGIPFAAANNAVLTIARMPASDDALTTLQGTVAKNWVRGGPAMALTALQRYLRETVAANAARAPVGTTSRQPDR